MFVFYSVDKMVSRRENEVSPLFKQIFVFDKVVKFHQEKIKSVLSKGSFLTQIDRLICEYKSPILSWFLTLGLLAIIGWLEEYCLLLPCILQCIRCSPLHIRKASPSLAMVELPAQSFQTLDFLVPTFWQKHRARL